MQIQFEWEIIHTQYIIRANQDDDDVDFDMNKLRNQIYSKIIKSTKKQTKVSIEKILTDDLSKRLLQLEFKSIHSIKSNGLK